MSFVVLVAGAVLGALGAAVGGAWYFTRVWNTKSRVCHLMSGFCTGLTVNGAESLLVLIGGEPTVVPLRALASAFANAELLSREPVTVERPATPPPLPREYDGRA